MAFSKPSYFSLLLLFSLLSLSFAMDMSIISYDRNHNLASSSGRSDAEVMLIYETWLVKHKKNYNALGEKEKRFEIFKDNLKLIDQHNSDESQTFKLGLNKFADLTNDEFRSIYLGKKTKKASMRLLSKMKMKSDQYAVKEGDQLPESVDWREKGAVASVKDQGACGKFTFLGLAFLLLSIKLIVKLLKLIANWFLLFTLSGVIAYFLFNLLIN